MTENDRGACEYHPGKMEKDWDWWLVYDGVAGSDSDVDRKQCPGGYIWACCKKKRETKMPARLVDTRTRMGTCSKKLCNTILESENLGLTEQLMHKN